MYRELTYKQEKLRTTRRILRVVLILAILVAIALGLSVAQAQAREQATISLRESVLSAAKQCCAVEGSYPSTLEHLEKYYGLSINHDDYVVSYEWFADNVLPSVVVTAR